MIICNKVIFRVMAVAIVLLIINSFMDYLPFINSGNKAETDKSIAVLPYRKDSPDQRGGETRGDRFVNLIVLRN